MCGGHDSKNLLCRRFLCPFVFSWNFFVVENFIIKPFSHTFMIHLYNIHLHNNVCSFLEVTIHVSYFECKICALGTLADVGAELTDGTVALRRACIFDQGSPTADYRMPWKGKVHKKLTRGLFTHRTYLVKSDHLALGENIKLKWENIL